MVGTKREVTSVIEGGARAWGDDYQEKLGCLGHVGVQGQESGPEVPRCSHSSSAFTALEGVV